MFNIDEKLAVHIALSVMHFWYLPIKASQANPNQTFIFMPKLEYVLVTDAFIDLFYLHLVQAAAFVPRHCL